MKNKKSVSLIIIILSLLILVDQLRKSREFLKTIPFF